MQRVANPNVRSDSFIVNRYPTARKTLPAGKKKAVQMTKTSRCSTESLLNTPRGSKPFLDLQELRAQRALSRPTPFDYSVVKKLFSVETL